MTETTEEISVITAHFPELGIRVLLDEENERVFVPCPMLEGREEQCNLPEDSLWYDSYTKTINIRGSHGSVGTSEFEELIFIRNHGDLFVEYMGAFRALAIIIQPFLSPDCPIKIGFPYPGVSPEYSNYKAMIASSRSVDLESPEGKIVYRTHKTRERDPKLAKAKKTAAMAQAGKLECECCSFDFSAKYGEAGEGFIECHHRTPLAELKEDTITTLDDLALVCSNCHRMLHRNGFGLTIEIIKEKVS